MKENLFSILWDCLKYSEQERFAEFIFKSIQEYLQKNEEYRNNVLSRAIIRNILIEAVQRIF